AASEAWQRVVEQDSQDASAWHNLGLARAHAGHYPEAIDAFSIGMQRGLPADEAAAGTGLVFCLRQQYDLARENLELAVAGNPANLSAWSNLVVAYARLGLIERAFRAAEHILALDPDNLSALGSLASLCKDIGIPDEAVAWARRAAEVAPDQPHLISNLMWAMLHADGITTSDILEAGRQFDRRARAHIPASALPFPLPQPLSRKRERGASSGVAIHKAGGEPHAAAPCIKVGWLSGDLRHHAVGRFVVPVLEALNSSCIESIIYNTGHLRDELSERAQRVCKQWHEVGGLSDAQLIELIRRDRLDLLIDLAGHTDGSRLAALAQRAAPVQASWLGYPDTTGLSTIDYVFVPPDPVLLAGQWCSEKPLALPGCYCVRELASIDEAAPRPADVVFTFGSLNNLAKLSPSTLAVWATILQNEPNARLILVATSGDNAVLADDLRARFAAHGADPAQLDIRGRMDYAAYRACWREIDLALDPFPFNGGTTGFDALCAGTPFVTLTGESLHARMGSNLLDAIGLSELVATSVEDYIVKAVTLARAPEALAQLRASLPQRLRESVLTDVPRFAEGLEKLFAEITGAAASVH
ncbi:MAG: hypothetical protein JWM03_575, partial [Rhodocyclales bacterium]|nr:hypothetical protein [Rhodocyclales bacterium]